MHTQQLLQMINTIHQHDTCILFQTKSHLLLWSNRIHHLDDCFILDNETNILSNVNQDLPNLFNNLKSNSCTIYKKLKNCGVISYKFNKTTITGNDKLKTEYDLWVLTENLMLSINDIVNYTLFSHRKSVITNNINQPKLSKRNSKSRGSFPILEL